MHVQVVLGPSLLTIAAVAVGIFLLGLSVGYTIWTGIGSIGTVVLGSVIYKEKISTPKVVAFAAIIAGALVLRLGSGG